MPRLLARTPRPPADGGVRLHATGLVTYWCVPRASWQCVQAAFVPARDLACLPETERQAIRAHALRHPVRVAAGYPFPY